MLDNIQSSGDPHRRIIGVYRVTTLVALIVAADVCSGCASLQGTPPVTFARNVRSLQKPAQLSKTTVPLPVRKIPEAGPKQQQSPTSNSTVPGKIFNLYLKREKGE